MATSGDLNWPPAGTFSWPRTLAYARQLDDDSAVTGLWLRPAPTTTIGELRAAIDAALPGTRTTVLAERTVR